MAKYVLNKKRDVDIDDDGPILNLPRGWRFSDEVVHVRGYDNMAEMRRAIKTDVIPCNCPDCAMKKAA